MNKFKYYVFEGKQKHLTEFTNAEDFVLYLINLQDNGYEFIIGSYL